MQPLGLLTRDQAKQAADDLLAFIHRVAHDKDASPAEIAALPEVAKTLMWLVPLA